MSTGHWQRKHERLQHEMLVAWRGEGRFCSDHAVNLSTGGLFINAAQPLPMGSKVTLLLSFPGESEPMEIVGRVARSILPGAPNGEAPGMGVEFVDLQQDDRALITRFVEVYRDELPDDDSRPPSELA